MLKNICLQFFYPHMKKIILFSCVFNFIITTAQNKKIYVLDALSKKPVPYVSLQAKGTNFGVFANDEGIISIPDFEKINDSVTFVLKSLGYYDKIINKDSIQKNVLMSPKTVDLDEVILYNYGESEVLNQQKTKFDIDFSTNSGGLSFARKFEGLTDYKLEKIFINLKNDSNHKKVLIEVCSFDHNNLPGINQLKEKIAVDIDPLKENLEIDLSANNFIFEDSVYYLVFTFLNFENTKSKINLGFRESKENLTFFKPYFRKKQDWGIIPNPKKEKYLNLNISLSVKKIN